MSEEPNLVGTMLGSYRITGELSRGGMGAVYRAEHAVLERVVAVKLLRPELTENEELVNRFINEARAASAIQHPGIIEVLDFGHSQDGRAYFVMEMLHGESLAQRIAKRGRLPEREAAQIARGVASALTAAHGKGIVHRDLKPDNVFLIPDPDLGERPKVLDFGIAKLGERAPGDVKYTQTGALIGTPLYMAPEQARAASGIDHRADLYSLGCMLYEMLVGEPPFVAVGAGEIIALQMFGSAKRPSERAITVAPDLETIVMRLLEKEPQDRFQTAGEVANALANALGEPVPDSSPGARAKPPLIAATQHQAAPRSSRGLIAGVVAAALIVIAVVAVVVLRDQPTSAAAVPATAPPPVEVRRADPPLPTPAPPVETPPVEPPTPAQPVKPTTKREKIRDQKATGSAAKHTKGGSPYEDDID
ncbi:MAG TPA: serine/threonine-protein kinase [Kofleriaceae bacterium]